MYPWATGGEVVFVLSVVNTELLRVLSELDRHRRDGGVTIATGPLRRVLQVARGELMAAESNIKSERLGDILAAEGRLDPALIEPIAAEAQRQGRLLGDQLITDGLLAPADLAGVLEIQALRRFERALTMAGEVTVAAQAGNRPVMHRRLGALVVASFRQAVPLEAIEPLLSDPASPRSLDADDERLASLDLMPAELRLCRRLRGGESFRALIAAAPSPGPATRFVAALAALGIWRRHGCA